MERMTGWQAIVRGLEAEDVGPVFGLPGSPGQFYDQLYDSTKLRSVLVRHETSGVFMAMAWARVMNRPAVVFGSPGPGVANLVPGVLEAYSGCTPMIVLGVRASTQLEGMGAFQETDQLGMMKPITKWAATIERTDRAQWYLRRAIALATSGQPGPVYLEFPADLGTAEAEFAPYKPAPRGVRPAADPDAIARAADLLMTAQRPLIVCGGGAVLSEAGQALTALIDRHGIPFQTTPAGRGVIGESHPLACGMVGLYRTTFPRELYDEADLLITVGSRMEEFQSGAFVLSGGREVHSDRHRAVRADGTGSRMSPSMPTPGWRLKPWTLHWSSGTMSPMPPGSSASRSDGRRRSRTPSPTHASKRCRCEAEVSSGRSTKLLDRTPSL
ncbi:MAG: thiamine pyrophosphate-binding protein [Thermomicrobiales bacterium]